MAYTWEAVWAQARETAARLLALPTQSAWFVASTPVSHSYAMNGLLMAYLAKSTLCIAMTAPEVAECASRMPPPSLTHTNILFGCPPLYEALLLQNSGPESDVAWPIDQAYCAGSPLSVHIWRGYRKAFSRCIRQNYGTSETGTIAVWARDDHFDQNSLNGAEAQAVELKSVHNSPAGADVQAIEYKGVAWGPVRVKLPTSGATLRAGEGELCVRLPWASLGYVLHGQLVPHAPWYRTGDAGHVDMSSSRVFVHRRLRQPIRVRHDPLTVTLQVGVLVFAGVSGCGGIALLHTWTQLFIGGGKEGRGGGKVRRDPFRKLFIFLFRVLYLH